MRSRTYAYNGIILGILFGMAGLSQILCNHRELVQNRAKII